ncbi:MAG: hypothetical protein EBQ97_00740 [Bacteroidetes bacterium]|nr:hypothetical protein [Bacteroidota bacterium]
MNERIKELAHKADFIGKKNNGAEWRWGYIDPELAEKLEKFAELIVRECAGVGYDASYYECALNVSNKIKQHFGVEE